MTQHSQRSTGGIGTSGANPLTWVAGICLLINVVGLFAFTAVALCVFGYIGLTLFLATRAQRGAPRSRSSDAGNVVLFLSWIAALAGGAAVGAAHWVQFSHAAFVVLALYVLAVVIWILGRAFNMLRALMLFLLGAAALAAVTTLHAPPGSDDMEKAENWTSVIVNVVDSSGNPIRDATVILDLLWPWQTEPDFDADRDWWQKAQTGSDGVARIQIEKDPRFKKLLIRVRREPFKGGYNEPTTAAGYIGYNDARLQTTLPVEKETYTFTISMTERAHPDTAYLEIELDSPVSAIPYFRRYFKLALTTDRELPWYADHHNFNDYAIRKSGGLREIEANGMQRLAMKLGNELVGRPFILHVVERDFGRNDEAYVELPTVNVDPIQFGQVQGVKVVVGPKVKTGE
jgi:hypothetical protein